MHERPPCAHVHMPEPSATPLEFKPATAGFFVSETLACWMAFPCAVSSMETFHLLFPVAASLPADRKVRHSQEPPRGGQTLPATQLSRANSIASLEAPVSLVELRPGLGVDIGSHVIGLLRRERPGMILRHVLIDIGRHLLLIIHACAIVE